VVRFAVALLLMSGSAAFAQGATVAGRGAVRLLPGWHLAWDDPFQENARAAGLPVTFPRSGGPGGFVSFAWGATEEIEVAVEGYGAWQQYAVAGGKPLDNVAYGLLLGARWIPAISPGGEVEGFLEAGGGPVLANVTGNPEAVKGEALGTGFMGGFGVSWNVAEPWAVSLGYRYLFARPRAPSPVDGTINAGGHFLLLGVAWHTAGQAPRRSVMDGF
jgi:opacity protein-like surface antigen